MGKIIASFIVVYLFYLPSFKLPLLFAEDEIGQAMSRSSESNFLP